MHQDKGSLAMEHYRYSVLDPGDPRFFANAVVGEEELLGHQVALAGFQEFSSDLWKASLPGK